MSVRLLTAILLSAVLVMTVAACDQSGGEPSSNEAPSSVEQASGLEQPAQDEPSEQGVAEGEVETASPDGAGDGQQEPRIASGADEPLPGAEEPEPVRPTQPLGIQRFGNIEEAAEVVPFALLEPTVLPENSSLSIVQIVSPVEGETEPGLPAARLIYDIDLAGVIVLYESPATGEPGVGEPIAIGAYEGWTDEAEYPDGAMTTLQWEQDGVRLEMRGRSIDPEALMAAAESLAPYPAGEAGEG